MAYLNVLGISVVSVSDAALWAEQLNNFGPTIQQERGNAGYVPYFHGATQPAEWQTQGPGIGQGFYVCQGWHRNGGSPNWPMLLLGAGRDDFGPRVILVRPDFNLFAATPGTLAVLANPSRLWELAGRGGAGWACWLAAPEFWPRWFAAEAAKLG